METPYWSRLYPGARALLFERLVDLDPGIAREPQPFRTLTIPELRASVRREVERLLNTRCAASATGAGRPRAHRAGLRYSRLQCPVAATRRGPTAPGHQITQAITAFEPRLRQVRVTVEPPTMTRRCLLAYIEAVLVLQAVTEPVAFPVLLTDESATRRRGMSTRGWEALLPYYTRELADLRQLGAAFARQYPKIATRLELGAHECADPHVERLLEAFAFLTARIQHQLDSEFPEITSALLGILYPQLVNPIPAMAIARFDVDPAQGNMAAGHQIAHHTPLFARAAQGLRCRFRTCYPVTLWPVQVTYAGVEPTARFAFSMPCPM